jgi:hypothetical protein
VVNGAKRERHRRFWGPFEKGEGAYIGVQSPITDTGDFPVKLRPPSSKEENLLDVAYCVERAEAGYANTFFGADAMPTHFVNFGPGVQAAFFGAPYVITRESVWFDTDPPIKSWEPMPDLVMNRDNILYRAIDAQTRALCAASQGRWAVSYTDIGGQYDILFSLRGEDMLSDMIDHPEALLVAQRKLDDAFVAYFNELTDIIRPADIGYTSWMPMVSDKPWYPLQCDMSVLISVKQFEKFVLPSLTRCAEAIGTSVYHLDGPEEIKFLDMFIALPGVHAIQWVPLPTYTPPGRTRQIQNFADEISLDVYRRSKAAGKKVIIMGVPPWQIPTIIDAVGADGMFIQCYLPTRKEADELTAQAVKAWMR